MSPLSRAFHKNVLKSLDTCRTHHTKCQRKPGEQFHPTRLLEIAYERGTRKLRLVYGKDCGDIPYAALSYKWGGPQAFSLTEGNINDLMRGFEFDSLGRTLQDAVFVAESLGLKYIWIDALCIFQHGSDPVIKEDKMRELRSMSSIYEHAEVTILASRSPNANHGFLEDRVSAGELSKGQQFSLDYRDKFMPKAEPILLIPMITEENEPLDSRAWALQERLLAKRIIDFGSLQTRWICRVTNSSGEVDGWDDSTLRNSERSFENYIEYQDLLSGPSTSARYHKTWHEIVQTYSLRDITEETDRLPGISALAQRFSRYYGKGYLAGLWLYNLAFELLWDPQFSKLEVRPSTYIGPTWSWVSINRPISYRVYWQYSDEHHQTSEKFVVENCFKVIKHIIQPKWLDYEFGEVEYAEISVEARCRPALWCPRKEYEKSKQMNVLFRPEDKSILPVQFLVDCQCSFDPNKFEEVYLMTIIQDLDFNFSMMDGYSIPHLGEATTSGAEKNDSNDIAGDQAEESKKSTSMSPHAPVYPKTRPVGEIRGLVLSRLPSGKYSRLGVFHFDHRYCEYWKKAGSSMPWNDRFREFHSYTKWMAEGEVQTFTLI
jgi:heterokaryon incompatibility protein (HET)